MIKAAEAAFTTIPEVQEKICVDQTEYDFDYGQVCLDHDLYDLEVQATLDEYLPGAQILEVTKRRGSHMIYIVSYEDRKLIVKSEQNEPGLEK